MLFIVQIVLAGECRKSVGVSAMGLQQKTSFQSVFKWMMLQPTLNKQCFAQMFRISTSRRGQLMQPYIYIYIYHSISHTGMLDACYCRLVSVCICYRQQARFTRFSERMYGPGMGRARTHTHKHTNTHRMWAVQLRLLSLASSSAGGSAL